MDITNALLYGPRGAGLERRVAGGPPSVGEVDKISRDHADALDVAGDGRKRLGELLRVPDGLDQGRADALAKDEIGSGCIVGVGGVEPAARVDRLADAGPELMVAGAARPGATVIQKR
jgi:hypothetical protein